MLLTCSLHLPLDLQRFCGDGIELLQARSPASGFLDLSLFQQVTGVGADVRGILSVAGKQGNEQLAGFLVVSFGCLKLGKPI